MKGVILIVAALLAFLFLTAEKLSEDGRAGYTGSPGETTCSVTSCHDTFGTNTGPGSVSATCNMVNWKYEPFTTYTISIKVAQAGVQLFGFGVEILNSTNNNSGNLIVTDLVHTQIKSRLVSGVNRRNVVHTLGGGASNDSMIFTFDWTSPDTSEGVITMYFAGNASNSSGTESGDRIYSSSEIIMPASGIGINKITLVDGVSVFPNPVTDKIIIHYNLQKSEPVNILLFSVDGSHSWNLLSSQKAAGENNDLLQIPDDCNPGLYLLSIETPSGSFKKKILVN